MPEALPPSLPAASPAAPARLLRRALACVLAIAAFTGLSAWLLHAGIDPAEERDIAHRPAVRNELMAEVRGWQMVTTPAGLREAVASPADLIVLSSEMVGQVSQSRWLGLAALKFRPGGGRRLVVVRLAVGAVEGAADKSTLAPSLIGPELAAPRGMHAVRYWEPDWQARLFGAPDAAVERLLQAGFDGVVVTGAEAFAAWAPAEPDAERRMVDLISALVAHAKVRSPDAVVGLENAAALLDSRRLRAALDFVVKDGPARTSDAGSARPGAEAAGSAANLRKALQDGVPVLAREPAATEAARSVARRALEAQGFVPEVTLATQQLSSPRGVD